MNIIKALKSDKITRKLENGLIEVKVLWYNGGDMSYHYFFNENDLLHGEYKSWFMDGTLCSHHLYVHGKLIKDYLKEE